MISATRCLERTREKEQKKMESEGQEKMEQRGKGERRRGCQKNTPIHLDDQSSW